jgi:small subunit ribosomal protein S17
MSKAQEQTSPQDTNAQPAHAPAKNQRRLLGRVTSNKMTKTVVVRVERRVRDPLMGKTITRSKKYHAHVDSGELGEGDLVEIAECRPMSRTKSWRVTRLVEKSKAV